MSFLIFVSQGQDDVFPSCAEKLAYQLKLDKNVLVLTISSGCSGFVQALSLANKLLNKKVIMDSLSVLKNIQNIFQNKI